MRWRKGDGEFISGYKAGDDESPEEPPRKLPCKQFLTNLANIIKVKSILTFGIVFAFLWKVMQGIEVSSEFLMTLTAIITYYFAKRDDKEDG